MHASGILCDDASADPAAQQVRAARSPDEATGLSPEKVALDDALPGGRRHPGRSPINDRAKALVHRLSHRTFARIITITAHRPREPSPGALSRSLRSILGSGGGRVRSDRETSQRAAQLFAGSRSEKHQATRAIVNSSSVAIEPRRDLAIQPFASA